jgi:hypothetical protein
MCNYGDFIKFSRKLDERNEKKTSINDTHIVLISVTNAFTGPPPLTITVGFPWLRSVVVAHTLQSRTHLLRIERSLQRHANRIAKISNAENDQRQPLSFAEVRYLKHFADGLVMSSTAAVTAVLDVCEEND